ncbi:YqaE/Pmp3 family membrane protein [Halomonas sp. LR5S13]|uniref:YqaE/Pmp3 family membrane protein n=1 Tax=Halomonas rhizosphaerae TaxID=3043296 RepID=UPI0024A85D4F|nr:YqaE/Pmp3 family membrane protein [Halomonas rhizosphaerae]MDI5922133.1 YqaE/Pmp3 family membrane protein [Halomonas rhizosphaerae]
MDAREYMAKKGLDGERDQERPNTLEEKAWSRAREAGEHRPRAGTPFDWEEWERYHETLAEGADALDQKIDHEAHRRALEHESNEAVQHFTPAAGDRVRVDRTSESPARDEGQAPAAEPRLALHALAVLLPPLAVGLSRGGGGRVVASLALTLLGWLPGVVHALWWLRHSPR